MGTRTPTATWSRRWCSKTSASLTQRGLATHRTKSPAPPNPSKTVRVLLKLMSSLFRCERVGLRLGGGYSLRDTGGDLPGAEVLHWQGQGVRHNLQDRHDYQGTNVETPNCYMEEKVINDVTCTNSVEFNCKRDKSTKNDGYGPKGVVCARKPTQSCYNIPRKIQVEVCKTDVHRYCEKFSNIFPFPVEEQNCHFEPKKICELEMKTRPKKAKKY